MPFQFSQKSLDKLVGVHKDLVEVVNKALEYSKVDFGISEGLRTAQRQLELYSKKKSLTMNSRHLYGLAIDVYAFINGEVSWETKYYVQIASAFDKASKELSIPIRWGGTFKGLADYCHFELDRSKYPDGKA